MCSWYHMTHGLVLVGPENPTTKRNSMWLYGIKFTENTAQQINYDNSL